jgi:hypothetical protein
VKPPDRESQGMGPCNQRIKHPHTGQFAKAAWLNMGTFYYVVFPDGHWYHEKYCLWEVQEERAPAPAATPVLDKTA